MFGIPCYSSNRSAKLSVIRVLITGQLFEFLPEGIWCYSISPGPVMKISQVRKELIKEHLLKRRESKDTAYLQGATRIDLTYEEDVRHKIKAKDFTFYVDESEAAGGTNRGPNPLSFFITGALSCLMNQYVRLATVDDIDIEELSGSVRGHFDRRIKGGFTRMIYDIKIKSTENKERILDLAKNAEDYCYVHNTLTKAVMMETNLYLNEELISMNLL